MTGNTLYEHASDPRVYLTRAGHTYGPYSLDKLFRYLEEGRASTRDLAWTTGQDGWIPLQELLGTSAGDAEPKQPWLAEALERIDRGEEEDAGQIIKWECDHCGLNPLEVDAKRMYLVDDAGARRLCLHPLEYATVEKHLGPDVPDQVLRERTGYLEDHFCPHCHQMQAIDPDKDSLSCSKCSKGSLRRGIEFAGETCPRCRQGTIVGHPPDAGLLDSLCAIAEENRTGNS